MKYAKKAMHGGKKANMPKPNMAYRKRTKKGFGKD